MRAAIIAALLLALPLHVASAKGGRRGGGEFHALGDQIESAKRQGNLEEAETLARRRIAIAAPAREHQLGNAYRNLASILRMRGKFDEAEIILKKALPIIERSDGPESRQAVRALIALGQLYTSLSRYSEAEGVLRDALARQLASAPQGQDTIVLYNRLARVERDLGRFDDAAELLRRAGAVAGTARDADGHEDASRLAGLRARTEYELGVLDLVQDRPAAAEAHGRRALAMDEQAEGAEHRNAGEIVELLGKSMARQGRLEEAELAFRQAHGLDKQRAGRLDKRTLREANELARTLIQSGKVAEAEAFLRPAVDDVKKSAALDVKIGIQSTYAGLLARRGDLQPALALQRESLDSADRLFTQSQGLDEGTRERLIGGYAHLYADAIQLLLRAHEANPEGGYAAEALSVVSRTQSRLFTELLRKADVRHFSSDPAFVELRGRQEQARRELDGLRLARSAGYRDESEEIEEADEDDEDSPAQASAAVSDPIVQARIERDRQRLDESIAAAEGKLAKVESELWEKFPRFMELTQPRPVTVEALQRTLLGPQDTLLTYFLLPDRLLIFFVEQNRFRLVQAQVARGEVARLVASVRRAEEDAASGLESLRRLDPGELHRLYALVFQPLEPLLKPGQRLLVIGDGPLYTLPLEMLVTRWGEQERRAFEAARATGSQELGEYATLSYLGQRYRFAYLPSLSALASVRLYRKSAAQYDQELVSFADPVFERPDRSPATKIALAALSRSIAPGSSIRIPRLPETADEAKQIASTLGGRTRIFLREEAQEHTAKTIDLRTTRYLHFATHGLLGGEFLALQEELPAVEKTSGERRRNLELAAAAPASPSAPAASQSFDEDFTYGPSVPTGQPSLVLSLSGDMKGEDGLLTMGEVVESMDLNAQLVVLSACNTAGETTEASTGEGFAGLTRAFMYAGAHGLIVSHWSVESRSTEELMTTMFRNLKSGADNLSALEKAREHIRSSDLPGAARLSRAHPYFWSPFVYVGD